MDDLFGPWFESVSELTVRIKRSLKEQLSNWQESRMPLLPGERGEWFRTGLSRRMKQRVGHFTEQLSLSSDQRNVRNNR